MPPKSKISYDFTSGLRPPKKNLKSSFTRNPVLFFSTIILVVILAAAIIVVSQRKNVLRTASPTIEHILANPKEYLERKVRVSGHLVYKAGLPPTVSPYRLVSLNKRHELVVDVVDQRNRGEVLVGPVSSEISLSDKPVIIEGRLQRDRNGVLVLSVRNLLEATVGSQP